MRWEDLEPGDVLFDGRGTYLIVKVGPATLSGCEVDAMDLEAWSLRLWHCHNEVEAEDTVLRGGRTLKEPA